MDTDDDRPKILETDSISFKAMDFGYTLETNADEEYVIRLEDVQVVANKIRKAMIKYEGTLWGIPAYSYTEGEVVDAEYKVVTDIRPALPQPSGDVEDS